jgi:hypothetical protein
MRRRDIMQFSVLAYVLVVTGCATHPIHSGADEVAPAQVSLVSEDQARQQAFYNRQQAVRLREQARWMEVQDGLTDVGPTRPLAEIRQGLAAANEADERARAFERQLPHGRLQ